MEAVDDQAECGIVGRLHDAPGMSPSVDVAAPGQRLVADTQAAPPARSAIAREVGGGARIIIDRGGMDVAAHQHEIGAECLHDVELAFGTIEVAVRAAPALPRNRGTAGTV